MFSTILHMHKSVITSKICIRTLSTIPLESNVHGPLGRISIHKAPVMSTRHCVYKPIREHEHGRPLVKNEIGGVVRKIPYVGNATGYVVESIGGGVYHVILSVGKLIGSASRRLGSVAKKTSDLVVFTLDASNNQLKDTTHTVDDLARRLSHSLTTRKGNTLRESVGGGRKRRRRRSVRKRRKRVVSE